MAVGLVTAGTEFVLGISEESTFGDAITATTSDLWKLLHLTEQSEWDLSGLTRDNTMRLRGSRVPHNTDNFFTRAGGEVVIPFTAVATKATLDFLLYGVLQSVAEGETPLFLKTFTWGDSTTQPLFTDNTGNFYTVVLNGGISSEDMIATTCILRDLTLSSDQGTNGGRLTVSGNFISGFTSATKFFESGSQGFGTATQPGVDYFNHCNLTTKTLAVTDMIVESYSVTFNNKALRQGCDGSGDTQTYALGGSGFELTGAIRVLYDDNTKGLLTDSLTSAFDTQLVLAYGSGNDPADTAGDFLQKYNIALQAAPARDFTGEAGTMLDLTFTGARDDSLAMVDIDFINSTDRSWPA